MQSFRQNVCWAPDLFYHFEVQFGGRSPYADGLDLKIGVKGGSNEGEVGESDWVSTPLPLGVDSCGSWSA